MTPPSPATAPRALSLAVLAALALASGARAQRAGGPVQVAEETVATEAKLIEASGLANQGDRRGAIRVYEEILADDPANSAAAYSAGRLYAADEQPERALELLQQARRHDPDNAYVLEAAAESLAEVGRHPESAEAYGELFARSPRREDFLLEQSRQYAQAGEPREGLRALERHLSGGGDLSPLVGQQRFTLAVSMNDPQAAVRALEELMAAYPRNPEYHQELAQFYRRTGDEDAARSVWRRMAERFPDDSRARLGLAGQSKLNPEEEAFLSQLEPVFADAGVPIDAKIMKLMPVVQDIVGRGDTVLANRVLPLAETLALTHPEEAKAHAIHGDLLRQAHRRDDAVAAYRTTLDLDPSVYLVWDQLLLALAEAGRYGDLLAASDEALTLFPNQARLYLYNGEALARTGDLVAGENALAQGLVLALDDQVLLYDLHDALAAVRQRRGRDDDALASAEAALAIRPGHGPALARVAEVMLRRGDAVADAKAVLAQAVAAESRHPYVLTVEALTQLLEGHTQLAAGTIEAAFRYGADRYAVAHEVAGDVAFLRGRGDAAIASWARAQALGGGSDTLSEKVRQGAYIK